jgi:hypothetical protein
MDITVAQYLLLAQREHVELDGTQLLASGNQLSKRLFLPCRKLVIEDEAYINIA